MNADPTLQNAHAFLNGETLFNLALPLQGQRVKKVLKSSGVVRFQCDAGHGWEEGWIVIHHNSLVARSGNQGAFAIPRVPAGSYRMTVWHEYFGTIESDIEIKAGKDLQMDVEF